MAYSSIFSICCDEIDILQAKTSVLYINTYHIHPYLVCGLAGVPVYTRATWQQIILIDNLDSGHMDHISDIPRLSTNEKAGVRGVVAENGRLFISGLNILVLMLTSQRAPGVRSLTFNTVNIIMQ